MAVDSGDEHKPHPEGVSSSEGILATAKGGGFLAGGGVFALLSRFGIAFILARALGAEDYGLYSLAISAGAIFAGVGLVGMDGAMVRYVSILVARKNDRGVLGTVQIGVFVATTGGLLMGAFLYLAAAPLATVLFDEPSLTELLQIMAFIVPFLTISNVLAGVSRGFGRMDHVAIAESVIQNVFRMALLGVLALINLDVVTAVVVFGVADVMATVMFILLLHRHFPMNGLFRRDVERPTKEVFGFAIPLWISGVINQFRKNIQAIFLGALSVAADVGIYVIVSRINLMSHIAYRAVIVAVKPVLARYHDQGDRVGLADVYSTTTRWTLTFNLPVFLVTVLYAEPLLLIFGEAFAAGIGALVVLAFAELAIAVTGTCGSMIDMTGHTRAKLANSVIWVATLAGANALLIPRWGVLGAAIASLIATVSINLLRLTEIWFLERMLPYRANFWKPVTAGVIAFLIGWGLSFVAPVGDSLGIAIAQGSVMVMAYGLLLLVFGFEPEDRLVLSRVSRRIGFINNGRWPRSGST